MRLDRIRNHKEHGQVWVHVCPLDAAFYWYNRRDMLSALPTFREVEIVSARGRLAPLSRILTECGGFVRMIDGDYPWFNAFGWKDAASDVAAGAMAEAMFSQLVAEHRFPFPLKAVRYDERADQFKGKDFRLVPAREGFDVEVKADFVGGSWGSGNLFVQTHEYRHEHGQRNAHRRSA